MYDSPDLFADTFPTPDFELTVNSQVSRNSFHSGTGSSPLRKSEMNHASAPIYIPQMGHDTTS